MNESMMRPVLQTRPKGRWKKRLGCAAVVLFTIGLLALGLFLYGRHLWRSEPTYWTNNQSFTTQTSQAQLTNMADRAFNRVMSELSNSSGYQGNSGSDKTLGVRTIHLDFQEANAWLATRLNDWLINQKRELPPGVSGPMLTSSGDSLVAVFRYKHNEIDQVFSVLLSLEFLENGQAKLHVDGIRGGRLPLPTETVIEQLPGGSDNDAKPSHTIAVLLGQEAFDPILPIDGARQARIIGMQVDDDSVSLIIQAEPTE